MSAARRVARPVRIATRAVLVDIEGTTSPIAFVHDVLFPYADAHLDAYVAEHRADARVVRALREAADEANASARTDASAPDETVLEHLHRWIAEDRKSAPLKELQGLIWAAGYASGELRGIVYPDAVTAMRRWHGAGIFLYVYSSGSIQAQQTLFGSSDQGDLRGLFSGFFDTSSGPKRERASYTAIARAIGLAAGDILFLSDVDAELDAARGAGMQTIRLLRAADTPAGASSAHRAVTTFADIAPERR